MEYSVHNPNKKLNYWVKKISVSNDISGRDKELILKFRDECFSLGQSASATLNFIQELLVITRWVKKDLDKLTKDDIKTLIRGIEEKEYTPCTKLRYKQSIKKFYQFLAGYDWNSKEFPDSVKWIKATIKRSERKQPEEILTREEILRLISNATGIRDKALVAVLYESGCRITEFLNIQIKHVVFDDYGCVISVKGKEGPRRIRLVSSTPYFSMWLEAHPLLEDKEAYVWISKRRTRLSYWRVVKIIEHLANEAGIKKPVNPHSFRHARATHLANLLTEAQMKEYFGWTQSSKMASVYVHLSGRDVDNAILKIHGLLPEGEKKDTDIGVKECLVCHEKNSFEFKYCKRCGTSLDPRVVKEMKNSEMKLLKMMTPEMIEKMIERKVEEMLKKNID
jgi:site-specific recombinase XerD